jgi:predicted DNA-binding ribbon-helix-helix protein
MAAHDKDADSQRLTRPQKRSFAIKGHRTSISMETPFWEALQQAAALEKSTLAGLVAAIDARRGDAGLSSAVRVWVLDYFRKRALSGAQRSDAR